jgi:hypothetical protein
MNFKVGDKVRVRKDRDVFINLLMRKLIGKVLTITYKNTEFDCYLVKENDFTWTDDMLEPVIEVGDTVRINKNATIEDIVKDCWNECQITTLSFIRKYGDLKCNFKIEGKTDKYANVKEIKEGYLTGGINIRIFELVSKKEPEIKEVTMKEVCEKFGCDVVIKKENK